MTTFLEQLDEAIAKGDMDLVKKIRQEMDAFPPIIGRPPKPKKTQKRKYTKKVKGNRVPKIKSEFEYFTELARLEKQRVEDIIHGRAGGLGMGLKDMPNLPEAVNKEDSKLDEKMGKKKRKPQPSRAAIRYVKKQCPRCSKEVEVLSTEISVYNWDMAKLESSEKPLFTCGQCH
jgi:hypothetical protein